MTVGELYARLSVYHPDMPVYLFADRDGLSAMEADSVSIPQSKNWRGEQVVCISAWEPSGDEPI